MNLVTIDDHPYYSDLVIKYVTEGVADEGYEVEFERFTSAEDFLAFLDEDPDYVADIVYCDVEMGGMSGVDLAEHIRRHYQYGSRIRKFVFVTSYRSLWIKYDGQITGKISKPFDKYDIVSTTLELMDEIGQA